MISKIEEMKEKEDIEGLMRSLQEGEAMKRADAAKALGMIEYEDEKERAISALVERVKEDEIPTVRANAALALGHVGGEVGKKALEESAEDEDWEVRHDAAIAMGEYRDERFIDTLYSLLEDDETDVQKKAIEALGKIGEEEKGEKIISELEDLLEVPELKKEVVKAIGQIGTEKALAKLGKVFENGEREIREIAVQGIGKLEGEEAEEILIEALEDESWRIREEAAASLGERGGEEAVAALLETLEDEKDHVVEQTLKSLGKLGIEKEKILDKIEEKTRHQEPSIRIAAGEALKGIDSEGSARMLFRTLKEENNPRVLWSIAESLSDVSKNNLKELVSEVKTLGENRKDLAAVSLGKAGFSKYADDIISMLDDDRWKVRQKAAEALRGIDGEDLSKRKANRALSKLRERCEDNDKWVRAESIRALGDIIFDVDEKIDTEKGKEKLLEMGEVEADEDVMEAVKYSRNILDI